MNSRTVFISYNPNSDIEQTLAIRLHTIGAVNGFKMLLPDRFNSENSLDFETKRRIEESDWFVIFSTGPLSKIVKEEIEFAWKHFKDKSKIIVVYDFGKGKTMKGEMTKHFTEIYFDTTKDRFDDVIYNKIFKVISEDETTKSIKKLQTENKQLKQKVEEKNALLTLLGLGVGLLILGSLSGGNK